MMETFVHAFLYATQSETQHQGVVSPPANECAAGVSEAGYAQ